MCQLPELVVEGRIAWDTIVQRTMTLATLVMYGLLYCEVIAFKLGFRVAAEDHRDLLVRD